MFFRSLSLSGNPEAFPEDLPISVVTDPTGSVYAVGRGAVSPVGG